MMSDSKGFFSRFLNPTHWVICQILLVLLSMAIGPSVLAKDLRGQWGWGYSSELGKRNGDSTGVPSISVKYAFTRTTAVSWMAGFSTASTGRTLLAGKWFANLFSEPHLNFYFTFGLGTLSVQGTSGWVGLSAFGAEFFIPGLESLGFSIETGATLDRVSGNYAIQTLGVSFLDAGIHFYF